MYFKAFTSPHIHQNNSVAKLMWQVLFALIPGICVYVVFFGWGIIVNLLLATITALVSEALLLWLRGKPIRPFLTDGSALITAWLLSSALPPFAAWWIAVIGTAFAIIFVKQLYGGLGYNPFNPAVAGYAMLLISFPAEMTHWPALAALSGHYPGPLDSLAISFTGQPWSAISIDALSSATPLDTMRTQLKHFHTVDEITNNFPVFAPQYFDNVIWISWSFLLGGLWLIYRGIISWHIPAAVLSGLLFTATLFVAIDSDLYPSPIFHLFTGGTIIGAFFIATDPVTAATTPKGRLIYGLGIGVLMNMAVPLIDYYTQPRVFGH